MATEWKLSASAGKSTHELVFPQGEATTVSELKTSVEAVTGYSPSTMKFFGLVPDATSDLLSIDDVC